MFLNYIISAHRNAMRHKVQSVIQVLSLGIGLAVISLVSIYLYDELTVEKSNLQMDQVYRVEIPGHGVDGQDVIPFSIGPVLEAGLSDISHMTRLSFIPSAPLAYLGDENTGMTQTDLQGYLTVDSDFFHLFPQEFIWGDPVQAFDQAYSVILTEGASKRLFGRENPVGQTVYMWNAIPNTVIGVIRDPVNTHLRFEALTPVSTMYSNFKANGKSTGPYALYSLNFPCYVRVSPGTDIAVTEKRMEEVWTVYKEQTLPNWEELEIDVKLRPLAEVHFAEIDPTLDYMSRVNKNYLWNLLYLGLGILLLGMINYVNLSTSRASLRVRELAMRKINGASRRSLIFYFLVESIFTTLISFLAAVTMVQLLFHPFNNLLQSDINLLFLKSPLTWLIVLAAIVSIGVLSGLYPALKMSSGSPLSFLMWESGTRGKGLIMRRLLMVGQFTFAIVLLIAVLTMNRQIAFMQSHELGFNTTHVAHMGTGSMNDKQRLHFQEWMEEHFSEIEVASLSQPVPGKNSSNDVQLVEDPESLFDGLHIKVVKADKKFFEVYGLEVVEGREIVNLFSEEKHQPELKGLFGGGPFYVINETCREAIGIDNPLGQTIGSGFGPGATIVGVVEDFHFQSLQYPVQPMVILLSSSGDPWNLSFKIRSADPQKTIEHIKDEIVSTEKERDGNLALLKPVRPEITLVGKTFSEQYKEVERLQSASVYLTVIAVIIACLGLFGLSVFMAQRRIKEIGIRKAMGATGDTIFSFLAKDFLKWVSLSVLLGIPLGYVLISQWQQQFAYQAGFGIGIYLVTLVVVLVVSLVTVIWQSLRASRTNPVDSLRTD